MHGRSVYTWIMAGTSVAECSISIPTRHPQHADIPKRAPSHFDGAYLLAVLEVQVTQTIFEYMWRFDCFTVSADYQR